MFPGEPREITPPPPSWRSGGAPQGASSPRVISKMSKLEHALPACCLRAVRPEDKGRRKTLGFSSVQSLRRTFVKTDDRSGIEWRLGRMHRRGGKELQYSFFCLWRFPRSFWLRRAYVTGLKISDHMRATVADTEVVDSRPMLTADMRHLRLVPIDLQINSSEGKFTQNHYGGGFSNR